MYRYAQIDLDTGMVVSDSYLVGEVDYPHMIPIDDDFDLTNKKYVDGEWQTYTPEPVVEMPTEQEIASAQFLLNQAEILSNQNAADETLAAILLNQIGG